MPGLDSLNHRIFCISYASKNFLSMKLVISSKSLLSALQRASGAVAVNSKLLPISEYYLLEVTGTKLLVYATNTEISIQTEASIVEAEGDFAVALPSVIITEALKSMPDHPISLNVDENTSKVEMTSEFGKYELTGQPGGDFPNIAELPEEDGIDFPAEFFEMGFRQTQVAALSDEMRKAMSGVSLKVEDGKLVFAATDGHRLIKNVFYTESGGLEKQVLLPRKSLMGALRPLLKEGEDINIRFSKENIFFATSQGLLVCRLVDQTFPNYESVIPQDNPNKLYLDRLDFINTLKRISLFSNQTTYQVIMDLKPQSLTISSRDIDFQRSGDEQFPCTYEGEDMTVSFNGRFLIEMLSVLESEQVRVDLLDNKRATLIFPEEKVEGQDITMLIMPVVT